MSLIKGKTIAMTLVQYQCEKCREKFAMPEDVELEACPACHTRQQIVTLKQKVTDAQVAGLELKRAVMRHEHEQKRDYEPTEHDEELWAKMWSLDLPNDSPSGIIAVIGKKGEQS